MELRERHTLRGVLLGIFFATFVLVCVWDGAQHYLVPQVVLVACGVNALAGLLPASLPPSATLVVVVAMLAALITASALALRIPVRALATRAVGPVGGGDPLLLALAAGALVVYAWAQEQQRRRPAWCAVDALVAVMVLLILAGATPQQLR